MASVALDRVSKVFPGGVKAVNRVSLQVENREFLVLVGPSGCGKSTTLRLIAGLEEVSEGEIRIGDRVVTHVAPKDRDIAMVFQNYALYPHMSVYKNMAFGLQLRFGGGWLARALRRVFRPARAAELAAKRRGIGPLVNKTADMLGIGHLLDRMPRQLSGGERQRVALGRAIVRQPVAFLFDEPLSNLDAKLRVEMRRELKRLHQRREAPMIYVTHDQTEALTLGDRIAVMNAGAIEQVGPPLEVYDQPRTQFVAGFIGTPPMNLVAGKLVQTNENIEFCSHGIQARFDEQQSKRLAGLAGNNVVFGVRPEDVSVVEHLQSEGRSAANSAVVSVVEPLGDATVVHLRMEDSHRPDEVGETVLISKTEARSTLRPGNRVALEMDMSRAHVFHPQTGENLLLERK